FSHTDKTDLSRLRKRVRFDTVRLLRDLINAAVSSVNKRELPLASFHGIYIAAMIFVRLLRAAGRLYTLRRRAGFSQLLVKDLSPGRKIPARRRSVYRRP